MNNAKTIARSLLISSCIVACTRATTGDNTPLYYLFSHGLTDTGNRVKDYVITPGITAQNTQSTRPENGLDQGEVTLCESLYSDEDGSVIQIEKTPRFSLDNVLGYPYATFDYPDATIHPWRLNFWRTSLAQGQEVSCLNRVYELLQKRSRKGEELGKNTTNNIVLFGLSRGASSALSFVATAQPKNICALIIESPFDSPVSVVQNSRLAQALPALKNAPNLIQALLRISFWQYREDALTTLDLVSKIPHEIPILLVAINNDKTVPFACTLALYDALKKAGHPRTHLLVFPTGTHGKLIKEHFTRYRDTVHAFYRHYNLPHNTTHAESGMLQFEQTQPPIS